MGIFKSHYIRNLRSFRKYIIYYRHILKIVRLLWTFLRISWELRDFSRYSNFLGNILKNNFKIPIFYVNFWLFFIRNVWFYLWFLIFSFIHSEFWKFLTIHRYSQKTWISHFLEILLIRIKIKEWSVCTISVKLSFNFL